MSQAAQIYPQPEYIFTFGDIETRFAIKNFPLSKISALNNGNTENIYETFMAHLPDLQEVYESLIDEESKKTFRGYWLGKISNRLGEFVYSNTPHYICAGFIPERGAIVIEGGTCDGGTATIFAAHGYKVYTFEMDKINYETARKVGEKNNFVVENLGLGSFKHEMAYTRVDGNNGASRLDSKGTNTAQITTLDSYVDEKNLPRVDFIKMDVEGAELDVLKGAAMTIARYKPILALSAYHKLDDFWTLTKFIKSVRPDYEFALRQCADTHEDVPSVYSEESRNFAVSLGLEPEFRGWCECVLFAR